MRASGFPESLCVVVLLHCVYGSVYVCNRLFVSIFVRLFGIETMRMRVTVQERQCVCVWLIVRVYITGVGPL